MSASRPTAFGVALVLLYVGCVGDSPTTNDGGTDATTDVVATTDASNDVAHEAGDAAPPMCDVNAAFGAPTMVTSLDVNGDEGALRFSSDYLTGYYGTTPLDGGPALLYVAQRSTLTGPFGTAQLLAGLYSPASTGLAHPSVTGDGLTIFFDTNLATDAGGSGSQDIFIATRPNTAAAFGVPAIVQGVDSANQGEQDAFIREDGQEIYFTFNSDIYRSIKGSSGFGTPTAVTELNTAASESLATVTPDDLVMYFNSTRTDGGAKGSYDIWVATRTATTDPFGTPVNVAEVNTADGDRPSFITRDRCTLYFYRIITPDGGGAQLRSIWMATKSP